MKKSNFINAFWKDYQDLKNHRLSGRYITFSKLEPELRRLASAFTVEEIGRSENDIPIHSISFGMGPLKILGWSQMHGNESTTTKALFDIFNLFSRKGHIPELSEILDRCTLRFIPMLNPDGAERYTRENINGVDLNRDANELTQVESRILRRCFEELSPDFCFNLHDQRSIFSAGRFGKPATVSFLAPAMDEERSVTRTREKAMKAISAMNSLLQNYIPGQVGRFDDAFNINCSGDRFQSLRVPTILFEAGHYPEDYKREQTRKCIALAMLAGISSISCGAFEKEDLQSYNKIPENRKDYCDILLRNVQHEGKKVDVSIQYLEKLKEAKVIFVPVVQQVQEELPILGHRTYDFKGQEARTMSGKSLSENDVVEGILLNREKISFKIE